MIQEETEISFYHYDESRAHYEKERSLLSCKQIVRCERIGKNESRVIQSDMVPLFSNVRKYFSLISSPLMLSSYSILIKSM